MTPPDEPGDPSPFSALDRVDRLPLAFTPTPLLEAPALARELGLSPDRLLLKMDAWTGFGLGGNKVRKLEYELAPSRMEGVTCLITAGGPQSNHCRVTAAAAAHLGLRCILVLNAPEPSHPRGNALLHRLLGAELRTAPRREDRAPMMEEAAREVERQGGRALVVPLGASTPLGALGYVRAARELVKQLAARDRGASPPTRIVLSTSSGGTLAGLFLGLHLAGARDLRILAVSADIEPAECLAGVGELAPGSLEILRRHGAGPSPGLPDPRERVEVTDAFVGGGYGIPTPEGTAALTLFARRAGILLDPTYTAKAAAGLVAAIRGSLPSSGLVGGAPDGHPAAGSAATAGAPAGGTPTDERWIFWHTGGHPALFAGE